jgi:hypothetical protein
MSPGATALTISIDLLLCATERIPFLAKIYISTSHWFAWSSLPPKADMCGAVAHVCYGPKADIALLFDYLVGVTK